MNNMNIAKKIILKILPVVVGTILMMGLIFLIYSNVIKSQTENCWERLDDGAANLSLRVKRSFNDNLNLLGRVADALLIRGESFDSEDILTYIKSVRESTIYKRIDVLFEGNLLLREDGMIVDMADQIPFDELAVKGTHISSRYTDHTDGEEVVYCVAPIEREGETRALLIGVIECNDLKDHFSLNLYGNDSQIFVIDRTDGRFLVDNWNPYLGSLDDLGTRETPDEYEDVDFESDILNGKTGRYAFVSNYNGKVSYMKYVPIEEDKFEWAVAVMVQDDVAMGNVSRLQGYMRIIAYIMTAFIMIYIAWNLVMVTKSIKNEEKARIAEIEKEKTRAKTIFLSSMSHDIRTPLNGIVGMLDVIDAHRDDKARVDGCLSKIRVSANYLTILADDIIDINEIESGKLVLSHNPFNINELIDKVSIMVNGRVEDAKISYYTSTDGVENPNVIGSEPQIQRVLINIVSNAIKYNKENGSVWLTVDELSGGDEPRYCFTVRDNGIGMSEEFQKYMFEAFEQENSGARTSYRGHGLGLTIVYSLVNQMNGQIHVDSTPGVGTTFKITLPIAHNKDIIANSEEEEHKSLQLDTNQLSGMKILIAEDNDINLEIAKVILQEQGAEVLVARNGREAVEAFADSDEFSIDLILMDIMMPEMDGMEAARAVRKIERDDARHIPILAMSAAAFADDIALAKESGMNEHVAKPLNIQQLTRTILKYTHHRGN